MQYTLYIFPVFIFLIIALVIRIFSLKYKLDKVIRKAYDDADNFVSENKLLDKDPYLSRFLSCYEKTEPNSSLNESQPIEKKNVELDLVGDKIIKAQTSQTILENSLDAGIDCKFECGGNARCSTCRVIILEGKENCLPRNSAEAELAKKKSFGEEVRLACQTYVTGNVKLRRLVLDDEDVEEAVNEGTKHKAAPGREMKLAILFCDIRSFTSFSEKNYPYDVIHMLNRYYNEIGSAIDSNSGYIDKYMGDGIMVLFGLNSEKGDPCVDAIRAGLGILSSLENVNKYLKKNFNSEFRVGIGVHYGNALIGELGFKLKMQFTALGDTVNMASRIEGITKKTGCNFLVSDAVFQSVANKSLFEFGRKFKTEVKGKSGLYLLHEVNRELSS